MRLPTFMLFSNASTSRLSFAKTATLSKTLHIEPTNHLDCETCEALIEAIKTFKGGVLIVSHDQYLLMSVRKDMYVLQDGNLELLRYAITVQMRSSSIRRWWLWERCRSHNADMKYERVVVLVKMV